MLSVQFKCFTTVTLQLWMSMWTVWVIDVAFIFQKK